MDILLQYPLLIMFLKLELDVLMEDLHQLHLLSQKEVGVIETAEIFVYNAFQLIARMVMETIINGDKIDFLKLISYLKSYKHLAYLAEYWEKIRKLTLEPRHYNYL